MSESARIVNAITGETVATKVSFFTSLEDFKGFVSHRWCIPSDQLLILLPFGHKLKISTFKECLRNNAVDHYEFYVYDRRLFSAVNNPSGDSPLESQKSKAQDLLRSYVKGGTTDGESAFLKPINSPLVDTDLKLQDLSYRTITSLLTTNLGWLSALEIDVHYFRSLIQDCVSQIIEILQCLSICEQYLNLYCYDVENLYNSNVDFLDQLLQNGLSSNWKPCYKNVLGNLEGLEGPLQQYVNEDLLQQNESTLQTLDQQVNTKLKNIKKKLDVNAKFRGLINSEIQTIRSNFTPSGTKDKLDVTMQQRFDELVEETRAKSRDILEQDPSEFTETSIEEVKTFLSKIKSEVAAKLFTIAKSLYAQTESLRELKVKLQEKTIVAFGQIAYIQVETLALKKLLLEDCNKDLELYQNYELEFAQIEDLPMIYGLYLIEKYRRESWFLQLLSHCVLLSTDIKQISESEISCRKRWTKNFGTIASIFCRDSNDFVDMESFDKLFSGGIANLQGSCEEQIQELKKSLADTLLIIEVYLERISDLDVPKDVSEVLMQNLAEAKNFRIVSNQTFPKQEYAAPNSNQLNGYKARIKKLETLLHETKISDPGHWPSGILHSSHFKPFHNNVSTVSSKITLNNSGNLDPKGNVNVVKVLEMENEVKMTKLRLEELQLESKTKEEKLSEAHTKLSDLELERNAFKETMQNLNIELSRLTNQEQEQQKELIKRQAFYQEQLEGIVKENKNLLKELELCKGKYHEQEKIREKGERELERVKDVHNAEKRKLEETSKELSDDNIVLQKQVECLRQELAQLRETQVEKCSEEIPPRISEEKDFMALKDFSQIIESEMFEIFTSDVFILENIGLLLLLDDNKQFQIKRVKGLRKAMNQSILDDSIHVAQSSDISVKSPVYHSIRATHEEIKPLANLERHQLLIEDINKLYDGKLFQIAVIKRFKDIESLAKKLTKENKKKRELLDKIQNEKMTLKNFQVGDLALFLPTRKNNSPMESSASSLNSSFSSVDLSSPPLSDVAPMHTITKEKSKKNGKQPWAAFTAFDNTTRYFLKDDNEITKGKDWFVGRITSLEQFTADTNGNNPYNLEKNAVWFQISADVISCQD
ncbi:ATG11 (YPR049C) [Zygosaccharomyces parabailii]|nr:ATG11 (YPR049C) [Zygosaccharomyces parabailii]CDH08583.1 related to Autophagy-related protein 11 [Zygosaccharomyces bailii ISA1307]